MYLMADMNVVDKNILDIINKNQQGINPSNVEITQVKIKPDASPKKAQNSAFKKKKKPVKAPGRIISERVKEVVTVASAKKVKKKTSNAKIKKASKPKTIVKKTIITKIVPKKDNSAKHFKQSARHLKQSAKHLVQSIKQAKELKKSVQSLSGQMRKKEASVQKQLQEHKQHLLQMGQDVADTKMHYQHIPKLSMETQMLIESMNKLSAVVKQLLVLFNQKISNEDGPLFAKLGDISEQNEQIAQGILAVADLVKEKQTPKAEIKPFNPYMPQRPMPMQVREQMQTPQQMPNIPQDLGKFQFPGQEQEQQGMNPMQPMQAQEQPMQPIPQFGAPLPPFSESPQQQQEEPVQSRKRMLF